MKKLAFNLVIILALFTAKEVAANKKNDVEKSKKIAKQYEVSSDVLLDISNSYGKVHINTWGKNTITVDIEIIVKMRSDERAQALLDKIDISIKKSTTVISFETQLGKVVKKGSGEEFEINYLVNMPVDNDLTLVNKYGDTYLAESNGKHNIKIAYGDFKFDAIHAESKIKISFSDGSMRSVSSGMIEIKYSDVEIGSLGNVKMENAYSEVSVNKAQTIDLMCRYGDMEIGAIEGIKGHVGYSQFSVDKLGKELDMNASYSGRFTIQEVAKNFTRINIDAKFGGINLTFEPGANFTFETEVKYADFNASTSNLSYSSKIKESFKARYKGKVGAGKGGHVQIYSSYGDIKFR